MNDLKIFCCIALGLLFFQCAASTTVDSTNESPVKVRVTSDHYKVIRANGFSEITLGELIKEASSYDIIFIGESHNDPVAHYIEYEVFKGIYDLKGNAALSLEMFERDTQSIVDEYLKGRIREQFLIKDARAWRNYESDYKPSVEFAKKHGLDVLAANAPRRYIRIVSTEGLEGLNELEPGSLKHIAPLPLRLPPTTMYRDKFFKLMGAMPTSDTNPQHGSTQANERIMRTFHAQVLWDATMAHSITEYYKKMSAFPLLTSMVPFIAMTIWESLNTSGEICRT